MRKSLRGFKWWGLIGGILVLAALAGCGTPPLEQSATQMQSKSATADLAPSQAKPAVTQTPQAKQPKILALGSGGTYADDFYKAMKPRIGENLDDNKGHELLARAIDTDHKYPKWKMSDVIIDHNFKTEERTFAYTFADESRITFHTVPAGYREGLKLTRVEIKR